MSLLGAVQALGAGDPQRALEQLDRAATNTPGEEARALSLRAQALFQLDRIDEAADSAHRAAAAVKRLDDRAGLTQVRALRDRILQAQAGAATLARHRRQTAALADLPDQAVLFGLTEPQARAEALLRKADALADRGDMGEAAALCRRALAMAPEAESPPRVEVLALLSLTRCSAGDAAELLTRARDVADRAGEPQLVTAVARAAAVAGHRFEPEVF